MYYFIVNPGSRSGNGRIVWQTVERLLEQEDVEYRVFFTSYRYHATKLAREITARNTRITLVAVGGDGTINEILNGIRDFSLVTFAYIPTGSSNDFARSLGLPADTEAALSNILHPSCFTRIDLGKAQFGDRTQYFAVSCGCGFDAAVCHEAMNSPLKGFLNRLHAGKLTYIATALRQLFLCRRFPVLLTLDGNKTLRFRRTYFAAFMNCRYEGGGLKLCPSAAGNDGFLNVCVAEGLSRLLIAVMFPTAFRGLHRIFPGIHLYRFRSAELKGPAKLPVHTDGEPYFLKNPLQISCVPSALSVISGPPSASSVRILPKKGSKI